MQTELYRNGSATQKTRLYGPVGVVERLQSGIYKYDTRENILITHRQRLRTEHEHE